MAALFSADGVIQLIDSATATSRVSEPLTARNVIVNLPVAVPLFVPIVKVLVTAPPAAGVAVHGLQAVPVGGIPAAG